MKNALLRLLPALLALVLVGCRGEGRLTILFSGDDRGWIVPSG
ncbi:MAG TPA: hypothetical protein VMT60_04455 [Candidatus Bathyarchaeia archaeon]|nr:hypothetical protein [Candidatus Bathyarchaeia archaeon]